MKRGLKKLIITNKYKFISYLLIVIFLILAIFLFSFSIIRLSNVENVLRILMLFLLYIYLALYIYKGYKYIINKNKKKYIILSIISIIISIILLIFCYYINIVNGTIDSMANKKNNYYTGYLITLKNNKNIETVGLINDKNDIEGYIIANEIIKDNNIKYEIKYYDNYEDMIDDLYNNKIDSAFVQSSYVSYFNEEYDNIKNDTKILYKKTIIKKNKVNNTNKKLDKPFTVLLMGVDSTDNTIESANAFNGDTLMLITFNPKTLNATMFSIPRDLYVPISCKKGASAKINTSSVGGIDCVTDTIKNLLGINVDYYARINFKGVVDLVEALHGINVYVTYPFCEQDSNRDFTNQICLKEGYQQLNGEETLAYARHRHTLPTGDLQRIQNQQLIVEAIAKKLLSLNTLTEFSDILDSIGNNVSTSFNRNEILSIYDIMKQMLLNVISDKDAIVVEKAYLEVYDKTIYNEKRNTYSAALGYYESSLNKIIDALKVNLELKKATLIKEFNFDANTIYEQTLIGKGEKNNIDNPTVPNFVGKDASFVEKWGSDNNITINKIMVDSSDSHFNSNVSIGLVGDQSIKAGTSLTNISSITIYINIYLENNDVEDENNEEENEDNILDNGLEDFFDIN